MPLLLAEHPVGENPFACPARFCGAIWEKAGKGVKVQKTPACKKTVLDDNRARLVSRRKQLGDQISKLRSFD